MDESEVVVGATLTDCVTGVLNPTAYNHAEYAQTVSKNIDVVKNEFMAACYISKLYEAKEWKRIATVLLIVVIIESLTLIFGGR